MTPNCKLFSLVFSVDESSDESKSDSQSCEDKRDAKVPLVQLFTR